MCGTRGEIEESDRDRARKLREIFSSEEKTSLRLIWPELKRIVCWNVIDEGVFDEVRPWLKDVAFSKGYYADAYALYGEADKENNMISLIPDDVFYEFLPVGSGDGKQVCTAADISEGEVYRLLVSNLCGLYRYDTGKNIICVKKDELQVLVHQNFIDAAVRAKKAGYDGVQLHGCHRYLINDFASAVKKRQDEIWEWDE